jgi:outer membrane protein
VALPLAPAAHAEDLLDIYRLAQQHDTAWSAAQENHRANREKGPQGRSLLLPTVSAGANYYKVDQNYTRTDIGTGTSVTGDLRYDSSGYNLTLVQPLFRVPNFAAYAQGRIAVDQAEAELAIARQDLIVRTAQTYFAVLAAQDRHDFARTEKAAIRGQLELAQRNFAVGNATVVDVHEARARLDLAEADELAAATDLDLARETLVTLTGSPPAAPLARPQTQLALAPPLPDGVDAWLAAAGDQNLQIKVQEHLLAIADEEVDKNRGGHYPALDLVAAHIYSDQEASSFGIGTESTTNQVGVQLSVPLYQGGYVSSKVREAVARREQTRDNLTRTRRDTTRQTREAWLAVTRGARRVQALELAATSSQRALESTLIGYESGKRTGIEVLNAQRELYRTKRDLSQARYDWLVARLRLKAAAGTLVEPDLAEVNSVLAGEPGA